MVTARDGAKVPVSMIVGKRWKQDGTHPLLEYAYGSYGSTTEATFNSTVLSLVDRGFAYAIAHIRGGQEMGRQWYDDGKMMKKKNTFNDFVDVGQYLVDNRSTRARTGWSRTAAAPAACSWARSPTCAPIYSRRSSPTCRSST